MGSGRTCGEGERVRGKVVMIGRQGSMGERGAGIVAMGRE